MSFDLSGDLRRLCPGPCEHPGRTNPQTRGTDGGPDNREAVSAQAGTYRRTRTSFALARICEASRQACIRSNMSMLTSKAFSMRSAISGDNAAYAVVRGFNLSMTSFTLLFPANLGQAIGSKVTLLRCRRRSVMRTSWRTCWKPRRRKSPIAPARIF